MPCPLRSLFLIGFAVSVSTAALPAQDQSPQPLVYSEAEHDTSDNLRDMVPAATSADYDQEQEERLVKPEPNAESITGPLRSTRDMRSNSVPEAIDPVLQNSVTAASKITLGLGFNGVAHNGWLVGDPNLAVGANQVVQWVNTRFAVYNKSTGAIEYGPVNGNTLWNGFGGSCQTKNSGDPIAQYDKAAARWVMMQHATPAGGPYYLCVAVSTTSDATGSFNRYAFKVSGNFPDYPKLGVWPDGYYVSFDQPSGGSVTTQVCALDRNSMLNGGSATSICFQVNSKYAHLLPSDLDGSTAPPSGSSNYFLNFGTNSLNIWKFHVNFQNSSQSTFTGPTNISVASFSKACSGGVCVPQLGTSQQLDSLGDRLMYRLAYRHFSDGHESLVVTHSIGSPAGVRWYEIRSPGSSPSIYQQGTYSPNSNWRWEGSAAMDSAGDIAMGYSLSSSSMHPGIACTGRLSTDALGTMESETVLFTAGGSEITGNNRWDDYTALSIDPVDDCTFWYTNEFYSANGTTSWSTHINSFKFSTCVAAK